MTFDQITDKTVSIVILTHNKLEYTKMCIESIRQYTQTIPYEIIVVDNNSTDGTRDWLLAQTDLKIIANPSNVGFPAGCNQGILAANGDAILLLNNDTVVTHMWLSRMVSCLYSDPQIGAVGPVTNNSSYYQSIPVTYNTMEAMQDFAREFNTVLPVRTEDRLKLVGFCMLIKRSVITNVGLLDESFSPGNFEDDDYSVRMILAGFRMMVCHSVFIHHFGSTSFRDNPSEYQSLMQRNQSKFISKWGFNPTYSMFIRHELIQLMDVRDTFDEISVLEIGCACGATLLKIKSMYPRASVHGIELNDHAAKVAATFADVRAMDVEAELSYPPNSFDYIILADVLEHLMNPWNVVAILRKYLKDDGKLIVSIPNVMHYSLLRDVIRGHWSYTDAGLLDRTHVRFFTLHEIEKMFIEAGYTNREYGATQIAMSEDGVDAEWVKVLGQLSGLPNNDQFTTYQYLGRIRK